MEVGSSHSGNFSDAESYKPMSSIDLELEYDSDNSEDIYGLENESLNDEKILG